MLTQRQQFRPSLQRVQHVCEKKEQWKGQRGRQREGGEDKEEEGGEEKIGKRREGREDREEEKERRGKGGKKRRERRQWNCASRLTDDVQIILGQKAILSMANRSSPHCESKFIRMGR